MKSNTSQCSQESEDLNSDLNEPVILGGTQKNAAKMNGCSPALTQAMGQGGGHVPLVVKKPLIYQRGRGYNKGGMKSICPTINKSHFQQNNLLVLGCQNPTSSQARSSDVNFLTSRTTETALKSNPQNYQILICSVEDFLARHSHSLEKGKASKISEAHCFLRLREFLKLKDLKLYSLKTSKAYSITKKGELTPSSFKRWMNWGMTFNGWYLTANFSESPRTGNVSLLSEVLEENAGQKYYLSKVQSQVILSNRYRERRPQSVLKVVNTLKTGGDIPTIKMKSEQLSLQIDPKKRQNSRRVKEPKESSLTVTAHGVHGIADELTIRRLTPRECERLQSFPDCWTKHGIDEKGNAVELSNTQRYKQMGNAVTVDVIKAIATKLSSYVI